MLCDSSGTWLWIDQIDSPEIVFVEISGRLPKVARLLIPQWRWDMLELNDVALEVFTARRPMCLVFSVGTTVHAHWDHIDFKPY